MESNTLSPLKVVIIRHGEKPEQGDNLSPQGLSRALQLPALLYSKFGIPNHIYVPSLTTDMTTSHARMFQTATPLAVQYNLSINSKFDERDYTGIANHILEKTGTALVIWEHHGINRIVSSMGVTNAPVWADTDFDSIWIITFNQVGEPSLAMDRQHLTP